MMVFEARQRLIKSIKDYFTEPSEFQKECCYPIDFYRNKWREKRKVLRDSTLTPSLKAIESFDKFNLETPGREMASRMFILGLEKVVEELLWARFSEACMLSTVKALSKAISQNDKTICDITFPVSTMSDVYGLPSNTQVSIVDPRCAGLSEFTLVIESITTDVMKNLDNPNKELAEYIFKMVISACKRFGFTSEVCSFYDIVTAVGHIRDINDKPTWLFCLNFMPEIIIGALQTQYRNEVWGIDFITKIIVNIPAENIPKNLRGRFIGISDRPLLFTEF